MVDRSKGDWHRHTEDRRTHGVTSGRAMVPWYVPEGAEFEYDMARGYSGSDDATLFAGKVENPWQTGTSQVGLWRDSYYEFGIRTHEISAFDVDVPTFHEEVEEWEVHAPLRPALRSHRGEFDEPLMHVPKEMEEEMAEHHTRQNQFHGQTGRTHRSKKGGSASPLRTIAADGCWCGESYGHDWPGKQDGAPHPREPFIQINEENDMPIETALSKKDLKGWNRRVAERLMEIVNDCGIRYRQIDGGHLLLYPPDGTSRPFKVAAARRPEAQLLYLNNWVRDHDIKETEVTTTTFAAAPAPLDDRPPVAPEPTETPKVREEPVLTASDPKEAPFVDGWKPTDRYSGNWETDGQQFRCIDCREEGVEFVSDLGKAISGHQRSKHGDGKMFSEEARAKATETRRANKMKRDVAAAVALISEAVGIEPPLDEKGIERLRAELAEANKRADEAEARLALIRETMGL